MNLAKEEIRITGLHCSGCADRVSNVLNELEGIRSADVSLDEKQAAITFDKDQVDFPQMKEAIEEAGYQAEQK